MASSGTYAFAPGIGALALDAFARLTMRPTQLTTEHLSRAQTETNLMLSEWANKQVNRWTSSLYSISLVEGTATYSLPASLVAVLAAYITITSGGATNDRIIAPLSTTDYAAIPSKMTQAPPTSYFLDKQITPQITLWPVPDSGGPYVLNLRVLSQVQDANLASGETPNIPYRFLDAFVSGLAHRLARVYRPDLEERRKQDAMEAWQVAAAQDAEDVPVIMAPNLGGYYR